MSSNIKVTKPELIKLVEDYFEDYLLAKKNHFGSLLDNWMKEKDEREEKRKTFFGRLFCSEMVDFETYVYYCSEPSLDVVIGSKYFTWRTSHFKHDNFKSYGVAKKYARLLEAGELDFIDMSLSIEDYDHLTQFKTNTKKQDNVKTN